MDKDESRRAESSRVVGVLAKFLKYNYWDYQMHSFPSKFFNNKRILTKF